MLKYENFPPALLTMIPVAKQIPKFASAPKPWAAFTNLHLTTLAILINRCSNFSLPASPRLISTILSIKIRMMPLLFLIQSICSLPRQFNLFLSRFPKCCLCNSNPNVPAGGTTTKAV